MDYVSTSKSPEDVSHILTATGLEVEGLDLVQSVPGGLEGIVVGKVVERDQHPNADRLSVTKVDVGGEELLDIVCGAPNVAAGQKVLVAMIGAMMYPGEGDPFKIKKGKIRGEVSEGMICAEDELGLGNSHDGIMVLNEDAPVGAKAADYLEIKDDHCIEIGLTPNRTDAMCHFGVARDLAAALNNMKGIENESAKAQTPDLSSFKAGAGKCPTEVEIKDQDLCPRYCGVVLRNIKVQESPDWLKERLVTIGLAPINNVVDITNYVNHEMGQPLHAFDLAKIKGNKVVVGCLKEGTTFTTLDGVERKLSENDLMISNAQGAEENHEGAGMCIAGVFGGEESGVSDATTDVFLESAYFNAVSIRKTARRHGLNTDASFRFERGVDPTNTLNALKRAAILICEIAGATIDGDVYDSNPGPFEKVQIDINTHRINRLIGQEIPEEDMLNILHSLEFDVLQQNGQNWKLAAPHYRVDVTREADVVEEILRIYGYDNIELPQKLNASLSFSKGIDRDAVQYKMSDFLSNSGWNEIMSNSLTKGEYATWIEEGPINSKETVQMLNPLSSDLNAMRQSLVFQGLEAIALNQNHRNADLKLFEFGKAYTKCEDGTYNETALMSLFATGNKHAQNWSTEESKVDVFTVLGALDGAFAKFGISKYVDELAEGDAIFSQKLIRKVHNKPAFVVGRINSDLLKKFDIKSDVFFADVQWDLFIDVLSKKHPVFKSLPKFPEMRRDLSLLVDSDKTFNEIEKIARKQDKKILRDVGLFDVYEGKNLPDGKKSYAVSFTFRDDDKTLRDKQVDKIMDQIQSSLNKQLGAELR